MFTTTHKSTSEEKDSSAWLEHALRFEQELLGSSGVADKFNDFLKQIAAASPKRYYSIFICNAESKNKELEWFNSFSKDFSAHLEKLGFLVKTSMDIRCGENMFKFYQQIETSNYVLLMGTSDISKKISSLDTELCTQLGHMSRKRKLDAATSRPNRTIPILINGDEKSSFPPEYGYISYADWKNARSKSVGAKTYFQLLIELVANINGVNADHYEKIVKAFLEKLDDATRLLLTVGFNQDAVNQKLKKNEGKAAEEKQKNDIEMRKLIQSLFSHNGLTEHKDSKESQTTENSSVAEEESGSYVIAPPGGLTIKVSASETVREEYKSNRAGKL